MVAKQVRSGNPYGRMVDPHLGLRGDRHRKDLWADLLPAAKRALIEGGFFTEDGKITPKGLKFLAAKMTAPNEAQNTNPS